MLHQGCVRGPRVPEPVLLSSWSVHAPHFMSFLMDPPKGRAHHFEDELMLIRICRGTKVEGLRTKG